MRTAYLDEPDPTRRCLTASLRARAGVGIIGGAPRACQRWLVLDPFVRLQGVNENDAGEVAAILGDLLDAPTIPAPTAQA